MKIEKYECDWCGVPFDTLNDASQKVSVGNAMLVRVAVSFFIALGSPTKEAHLCVDCQRKALTQAVQQFEKAEGV
jgi:hypothetical protein